MVKNEESCGCFADIHTNPCQEIRGQFRAMGVLQHMLQEPGSTRLSAEVRRHDRGNISDFCFISGTWMDYRYVWRQAAIKDSGSWVIFVRGESRWVHKLCYYQMLLISFGSSFSQCVQNVVWTIELTHALGAGTSFPGVLNLFILI